MKLSIRQWYLLKILGGFSHKEIAQKAGVQPWAVQRGALAAAREILQNGFWKAHPDSMNEVFASRDRLLKELLIHASKSR